MKEKLADLTTQIPEFQEKIKLVKAKREPVRKKYEALTKKIRDLDKAESKYIFENKLYYPLDILEKYKGKQVSHVEFYTGEGALNYCCSDEICEIDKDGHFYKSSYIAGIIHWSDEDGCYCEWYHHGKTKLDYVGIKEIVFATEEDDDDDDEVTP